VLLRLAPFWFAFGKKELQSFMEPELLERWDDTYGDRMTEIVFIGMDINRQEIEASLDACLLTDEEMSQDWTMFVDPFPASNSLA
jgi:Cobalamin synthesis protein cobW C-terminal domain